MNLSEFYADYYDRLAREQDAEDARAAEVKAIEDARASWGSPHDHPEVVAGCFRCFSGTAT